MGKFNRISTDGNHGEIVSAFESIGAVAHFIGEPCDLIVMFKGECCLVEIKRDHRKATPGDTIANYRFTQSEKDFFLSMTEKGARSYAVIQTRLQAGQLVLAMQKGDKIKFCKERVASWIDDVYREPGEIAQLKKFCR